MQSHGLHGANAVGLVSFTPVVSHLFECYDRIFEQHLTISKPVRQHQSSLDHSTSCIYPRRLAYRNMSGELIVGSNGYGDWEEWDKYWSLNKNYEQYDLICNGYSTCANQVGSALTQEALADFTLLLPFQCQLALAVSNCKSRLPLLLYIHFIPCPFCTMILTLMLILKDIELYWCNGAMIVNNSFN